MDRTDFSKFESIIINILWRRFSFYFVFKKRLKNSHKIMKKIKEGLHICHFKCANMIFTHYITVFTRSKSYEFKIFLKSRIAAKTKGKMTYFFMIDEMFSAVG